MKLNSKSFTQSSLTSYQLFWKSVSKTFNNTSIKKQNLSSQSYLQVVALHRSLQRKMFPGTV